MAYQTQMFFSRGFADMLAHIIDTSQWSGPANLKRARPSQVGIKPQGATVGAPLGPVSSRPRDGAGGNAAKQTKSLQENKKTASLVVASPKGVATPTRSTFD
eukprot:c19439_g2_i1.p4 GENE.c19439_g2_i1~~c19439_g2_i1.p4  ORF type:complete len:102 (-),score=6.76 c19439_g2_i1:120-425(-)